MSPVILTEAEQSVPSGGTCFRPQRHHSHHGRRD